MCRVKAILIGCFLFGAYALVSEMDYQDAVARETFAREHRNWVARNCIPQRPHERAVIEVRHNGSTQCSYYENAGYGRAPKLVFAEVRE
jgi:hypothetical protein